MGCLAAQHADILLMATADGVKKIDSQLSCQQVNGYQQCCIQTKKTKSR